MLTIMTLKRRRRRINSENSYCNDSYVALVHTEARTIKSQIPKFISTNFFEHIISTKLHILILFICVEISRFLLDNMMYGFLHWEIPAIHCTILVFFSSGFSFVARCFIFLVGPNTFDPALQSR